MRRLMARRARQVEIANSACRGIIPEIKRGYGAEGPYGYVVKTVASPAWAGHYVSIFFPVGLVGRLPVIFFSHGFGATDWKRVYAPFMRHMVSREYIVVYSPYETFGSTNERYSTLWKGFEAAVQNFGERMDLSRVGFVGHSFGGGATPEMAYRGFVKNKWGKKGAFIYMLAPWYSFQITQEQLRSFPRNIVFVEQVYDKDKINDHRMAIDIYRNIRLPESRKYFQVVRSEKIGDCELEADHSTPGRNPSLYLKQYSVFRTFDALADYAFNGNRNAKEVLLGKNQSAQYHPVIDERNPEPKIPQQNYHFSWDSGKNPRRPLEKW